MTNRSDPLYELDEQAADGLREPVLLVALDGYVDAGNGVALVVQHLLGVKPPEWKDLEVKSKTAPTASAAR